MADQFGLMFFRLYMTQIQSLKNKSKRTAPGLELQAATWLLSHNLSVHRRYICYALQIRYTRINRKVWNWNWNFTSIRSNFHLVVPWWRRLMLYIFFMVCSRRGWRVEATQHAWKETLLDWLVEVLTVEDNEEKSKS